jgi:hypothetical protein
LAVGFRRLEGTVGRVTEWTNRAVSPGDAVAVVSSDDALRPRRSRNSIRAGKLLHPKLKRTARRALMVAMCRVREVMLGRHNHASDDPSSPTNAHEGRTYRKFLARVVWTLCCDSCSVGRDMLIGLLLDGLSRAAVR